MIIKSKFDTGDRVWVVQNRRGVINVYSDIIAEICVCTTNEGDEIQYWLKDSYEYFSEKEIINYEDEEELISIIKDLDNKIITEKLMEGD